MGRAIRVPGSLNPSTRKAELIIADTVRPLLDHLASAKKSSKTPLLKVRRITCLTYQRIEKQITTLAAPMVSVPLLQRG